MRIPVIFLAATGLVASLASAAELFVAPQGSDTAPGTRTKPLRSFAAAQQAARALAGKEPVTVTFADGVYYLPQTIVFTPTDSGTPAAPVTYKSFHEGGAILSGGQRLALAWSAYKDGIQQASVPAGLVIDQLWVDGVRQHMARYPNYDPSAKTKAYNGYSADAFSPDRAARWSDPAGGYIHAMHSARWGGYHYRITGKDAQNVVTYEGGWQNNRQMGMHKDQRMVENIFEELDAPGEWFHNQKTNTLYFRPAPETKLSSAVVEVVRLPHLVEFQGTPQNPVAHVALDGFVLRHAARTFMDNKEPLLRSDWTIYRGGAILFNGARRCTVANTEFDQVGGNAIFVNKWNRELAIKGCYFHDIGASAVAFVGDPDAVRSPLFEYGQHRDWAAMDRTPGPKSDNYPADCVVEDSLMHGLGQIEKQGAGVQVSMSARITIRQCSIYDASRSGININEGTFGGHVIEGCDIFDTVQETHDHGSFNSWGRDRFWHPRPEVVNEQVAKDPTLPLLDITGVNIIRDSRWRCDHGWDVDLDDGSSNYEIYNNLFLKGGLKLREGYRRIVTNNVLVNNTLHPHVWLANCGDVFKHNIVMGAYQPAVMPANGKWGEELDYNLFTTSHGDRLRFAANGADEHSLVADPLFVDPAKGDYRVKPGSPALALGFKNFAMDRFGVLKPSLRAKARTPELPVVAIRADLAKPSEADLAKAHGVVRSWMGGSIRNLEGEEFSAYGVTKDSGGVAIVEVPANSPLAKLGLKAGDLVQGIGATPVTRIDDIARAIQALPSAQANASEIRFVRTQSRFTLTATIPLLPPR